MTILKRQDVIPGQSVAVIHDGKRGMTDAFLLNHHEMLTRPGGMRPLLAGEVLEVLSKPRKLDGINLVKVRVGTLEGHVYYTDLVNRCAV
jgi:hypothetical protein